MSMFVSLMFVHEKLQNKVVFFKKKERKKKHLSVTCLKVSLRIDVFSDSFPLDLEETNKVVKKLKDHKMKTKTHSGPAACT